MPSKPCANCPVPPNLPQGTLAPSNANTSTAIQQAQKIRCFPGSITVQNRTSIQSGTYVTPTTICVAPIYLATIYFNPPFVEVPFVTLTVDDYGNNPPWIIHLRNLSNISFDLILKNADKAAGISFAVLWNAIGA